MATATANLTNGQALTFVGKGPIRFGLAGTFVGTVDLREKVAAGTYQTIKSYSGPTTESEFVPSSGGREFSALATLSSGTATPTFWD